MAEPPEPALAELLRMRAAEAPATTAFVVDGEGGLTYQAWERRSNAVARGLQQRRLGLGDRVVLWFDASRWAELAVAYAGVHKAGAVAVPLGSHVGGQELARIIAHCGASAIVSPAASVPGPVPTTGAWVARAGELEEGQDDSDLDVPRHPPGPAEISYRSRSLELPRATTWSAGRILSSLAATEAVAAHPVVTTMLQSFAVGTDGAREALWFPLARSRGPVVVLPAFDPDRFCALTAEHRVGRWSLAPSVAHLVLDSGAVDRHDVSSVAHVVLQGGRSTPSLLGRLGDRLPDASLLTVATGADGGAPEVVFAFDRSRPGSLGRALGPGAIRVVGAGGRDLPEGELGQVQSRHPDVRGEAEEWRTLGELGYADHGFVYLVDSGNEVIRCRGSTVSEADVVGLVRRHPAVADAALIGIPHDSWADQLAIAVTLSSPAEPGELREAVGRERGELGSPESVLVVEQLPRNRAGTLLRRRLRAAVGLPVARPMRVAPRNEVEETIVSAWERVLGSERIGVEDDFFELGGDQLTAHEVLSLLEDALDVRLPLSTFLESPTVAALASAVEDTPVPAEGNGPRTAPLAASQEGMVWHEQFAPGSQSLPPLVRRYRGPFDAEVFGRAVAEMVRRHEPLRTTFAMDRGRPVQVVSAPQPSLLSVRDLTGLAPGEQDEELARVLSDAGRPFDLVEGPLFEPILLRLASEDHVAVLRVHHAVYDDWSVSVFRRELNALYGAMSTGQEAPLSELPLSFTAFSRGQRRRLAGPAGTAQLSWWRDRLAGGPLSLQLPIGDPDRPEGSPQASAEPVSVALPPELSAHLRALAQRERATVFMTVLAAFEVLLHRYTGQSDLLLASVVANRNRSELEGMVGCFTKKIPLRQDVPGDATFAQVLARTRSVLLGALSNQDLPFEAVVQEGLGQAAAAHGLVPQPVVMVQGVTPQTEDVTLAGITTSGYETSATTRRAHFAAGPGGEAPAAPSAPWGAGLYGATFIILSVTEAADHLSLSARGAFHRPAVERLLANFATLLADIVDHPFRPVSELALIAEQERALVAGWDQSGDDFAIDRCAHHLFEAQVARTPSRIAVVAGDETLTYAELDARADALADRLRFQGVGRGSLVGLCLPPSADCVIGVLATWKAGAGYVGLDGEDSEDHLSAVLDDASLDAVLAPPDLRPAVLAERAGLVQASAGEPAPAPARPVGGAAPGPGDPALLFHGSGRSALPEGVVLEHRCVVNLVAGLRRAVYRLRPGDGGGPALRVGLSAAPTDDAFLRQLVGLLDGHTLHVMDGDGGAAGAVSLLGRDALDLVDCTPEEFGELAAQGLQDALRQRSGGAVTPVIVVGSRAPVAGDVFRALAGLDRAGVVQLFGPPGCSFGATVEASPGAGGRLSVGRPMANVTTHVLDGSGTPVPVGAAGELHVGGAGVARGYLAGAALGGRQYPTGLLARYLPDGRIEVLSAVADTVDFGGLRIDRARMEAALGRCPAVREARIVVSGDRPAERRLVAHVVPRGPEAPTLARLQAWLWTELPGYAWPAALVLVAALPAPAGADGAAQVPEARFLAALWAEVLGVDDVPLDENYWQRFSFLEVVARARAAGVRLGDHQVTRNRTLATLAADMAAERLGGTPGWP